MDDGVDCRVAGLLVHVAMYVCKKSGLNPTLALSVFGLKLIALYFRTTCITS